VTRYDLDALLPRAPANPWQTVSSRVAFEARNFVVRDDAVITPGGALGAYHYFQARHPIAAVCALDDTQHIYLVRQWRYPWGRDSWELPAGAGGAGEDLLSIAKRELQEETGVAAERWTPLGNYFVTASGNAVIDLFLAEGLVEGDTYRDEEEGDMIVRRIPLAAAVEAALDGHIVHAVTISALFRLTHHLARRDQ
jgi:8-oxo-dGTP pyrophosphatase MutT (NUDIX family)